MTEVLLASLLRELKIIGKLEPYEQFIVENGHLRIEDRTLSSLRRAANMRVLTISAINFNVNSVIEYSKLLLDSKYMIQTTTTTKGDEITKQQHENDERRKKITSLLKMINEDLQSTIKGCKNLMTTYEKDKCIMADLEQIISKIQTHLSSLSYNENIQSSSEISSSSSSTKDMINVNNNNKELIKEEKSKIPAVQTVHLKVSIETNQQTTKTIVDNIHPPQSFTTFISSENTAPPPLKKDDELKKENKKLLEEEEDNIEEEDEDEELKEVLNQAEVDYVNGLNDWKPTHDDLD